MRGTVLVSNPSAFPSFELAHRIEGGEHIFEVAYGSSFNELYYEFTPLKFVRSADRPELERRLECAGQGWLAPVLRAMASGTLSLTPQDIEAMVVR